MGTATDDGCTALTLAAGPMLIGDTLNELVTCLGLAGVRMEWLSDGGRVVGRSIGGCWATGVDYWTHSLYDVCQ